MSSRTRLDFVVKLNAAGETLQIKIADPGKLEADNLALATWGSSQILADTLHRLTLPSLDQAEGVVPVLELGAGTGLAGLTAAAVWKTSSILTDLSPILPNIEANVAMNAGLIASHGGASQCGILDWANPGRLQLSDGKSVLTADADKARVILAADTVYSEEHPELLTQAVGAWLAQDVDSRLIICYPLRIGYLDHIRDLWERLESAGLESIEEGREQADESWDEDVPYEWCVWRWKK